MQIKYAEWRIQLSVPYRERERGEGEEEVGEIGQDKQTAATSKQVRESQAGKQYQSFQKGAPEEKTRAGVATKTQAHIHTQACVV